MKAQIIKRNFEALRYVKDSDERKKLNENPLTSEYMTSYKYARVTEKTMRLFRTKREAERS